jgi:hypothetical protein
MLEGVVGGMRNDEPTTLEIVAGCAVLACILLMLIIIPS